MKKLLFVIVSFFFLSLPVYAQNACVDLRVVSGNNRFVPSTVTFQARAADTNIQGYRFYFGDGSFLNSTSSTAEHIATISGTFTARANILDAQGREVSDPNCQTIYSLLTTPLESHKSGCGNVFIEGTSMVPTGSSVKFLVTGYDNKAGVQEYRIDFGNGQIKQGNTGNFDLTFPDPGTFLVTGSIRDSKNQWLTSPSCQNALYVSGGPIAVQPSTGVPTWVSIAGILAGILLFLKWRSA